MIRRYRYAGISIALQAWSGIFGDEIIKLSIVTDRITRNGRIIQGACLNENHWIIFMDGKSNSYIHTSD